MENPDSCPDCGAAWSSSLTCTDYFHEMLFWEAERPDLGIVHHLMVLCYHLQHPGLYSQAGLEHARNLLTDFVAQGISPAEVRRRQSKSLSSSTRRWKVTASAEDHGSYGRKIDWRLTAADVIAGGPDHYIESVQTWVEAVWNELNGETTV